MNGRWREELRRSLACSLTLLPSVRGRRTNEITAKMQIVSPDGAATRQTRRHLNRLPPLLTAKNGKQREASSVAFLTPLSERVCLRVPHISKPSIAHDTSRARPCAYYSASPAPPRTLESPRAPQNGRPRPPLCCAAWLLNLRRRRHQVSWA